jgi:hypothetical protein
MALFGLFGKKSDSAQLKKWAERAQNRRAQAIDRWEAIQALVNAKSPEAVEALLPRFTFYVDPSITDQDEKDLAFDGIVAVGEGAVEPVVTFLRRADSISWPLKMLDRILGAEAVVEKVLELLSGMDTEYERDPQRKVQMLATLEERVDPRIASVAVRFLQDANETVRFHAAGAVLAQAEASEQKPALLRCFCSEASVRVRNRILDGFSAKGWDVGEMTAEVQSRLPAGYSLDRQGVPRRA